MCIYLSMNRNLSRYRLFAMTAVLPWNIQSYEQKRSHPNPKLCLGSAFEVRVLRVTNPGAPKVGVTHELPHLVGGPAEADVR